MGDDAEYYIEQQQHEARFRQSRGDAALDHNSKPMLCWADGVGSEDEIWSWEPLDKILGIFSKLHRERHIGSDYFLASRVPNGGDEEDWDNENANALETDDIREIKVVNELEFQIANSGVDATHEVIVLSRYDADLIRGEVVRQKGSAKTLKEKILVEMLEEMVSVMEANSKRNTFVFARTL